MQFAIQKENDLRIKEIKSLEEHFQNENQVHFAFVNTFWLAASIIIHDSINVYVYLFLLKARIEAIALVDSKIETASKSFLLKLDKDISEVKVEMGLENNALRIDHDNFVKVWHRELSCRRFRFHHFNYISSNHSVQDQELFQVSTKRENELRKRETKAVKEKTTQQNEVSHRFNVVQKFGCFIDIFFSLDTYLDHRRIKRKTKCRLQ